VPFDNVKLNSWWLKDRVHLTDLTAVGLRDASWPARRAQVLHHILQALLANTVG